MSTATKETNYNIDQIKKNAAAGTLITDQADLQKYGIDYFRQLVYIIFEIR